MSIVSEINRINAAKAEIRNIINDNGGNLAENDTIDKFSSALSGVIDTTGGGGGSLTGKGFRLVASSPSGGGYITGGLNINIETGTINNASLTGVGFVI